MADNSQPLDHPPGPLGDRGDTGMSAAVRALEKLVDLTTLEVDLTKAQNALISMGGKGAQARGTQGTAGGSGFGGFFQSQSASEEPKGMGHVLGDMFGEKVAKSRPGQFGRAGGELAKGALTEAGFGGEAVAAGGAAASVIGVGVAVGILFVEGMIKARNAINDWTDAAFDSAKKLAEVSGSMAAVVAQRQVAEIRRDYERGERTAGSAAALQQAEARRKTEENKLGVTIDNATNVILTFLNNALTPLINKINAGVEIVKTMPPIFTGILGAILRAIPDEVGTGSLNEIGADARREMAAEDARGARLMAMAAAAAAAAVVGRAPEGAAPLRRGPFGPRP